MSNRIINVLSLGVGVQSSTVLMLANQGLIDTIPDVAIFADTGDEPEEVYAYLEYLQGISRIPIIVQKEKDIIEDLEYKLMEINKRYANPPFFVRKEDGKLSKLMRICTKEYKIEQVERALRYQVLKLKPRQRIPNNIHVNMMIGISTDEIERVKPSQASWIKRVYPLIDE